jgi:hypothetical protein
VGSSISAGDDEVGATSKIMHWRSLLSAIVDAIVAGSFLRSYAAIQDDLDLPVILKPLDKQLVQLRVLPRNDEQVPRPDQERGFRHALREPTAVNSTTPTSASAPAST